MIDCDETTVVTFTVQSVAEARRTLRTRRVRRGAVVATLIVAVLAPSPIRELSPWASDTAPHAQACPDGAYRC